MQTENCYFSPYGREEGTLVNADGETTSPIRVKIPQKYVVQTNLGTELEIFDEPLSVMVGWGYHSPTYLRN